MRRLAAWVITKRTHSSAPHSDQRQAALRVAGRKAIMEFRVLGPIELWSAGQKYDLGPARARSVLAILALTPRTLVPSGVLIDRIWDTRPPPKARESLSVYITRLRGSLRQAVGDDVRLAGRAGGYELDVPPEAVDLHVFRRLRQQAETLAGQGDGEQAAALLREADRLWRGPALAGIYGDWVTRMRDGLAEERRAAMARRVECELELGRHAELVGELRPLLAQYPFDEAFIAHQMTALYRSGRPGDALSLYRETRRRLIEEHGTEPGPALAELHQRILSHDPRLAGRPGGRAAGPAVPDTLPPQAVQFVGRQAELELLTRDDGGTPPISIIEGMAGVGKTALALQAARRLAARYPDGICYLHLHTHDPGHPSLGAAEALHRLLRMLTAPGTAIPDPPAERAALLRAQLSRRRAVLILDDAADYHQIASILTTAGPSQILITTRRRLAGVARACTLTLDMLPLDDAVTLFRRLAGPASGGDENGGGDESDTAAAVRLCGNLPLAIQLAAGRLAQRATPRLADLVEELSQSPADPGSVSAATPELRSAFDLSYGSLEPDHQRFFRLLGISPCSQASLPAAAALSGVSLAEAERACAALLDHHLLAPAPAGQFRFHALIREYAHARATQEESRGERRQAVGRLLDYYLHTADRADRALIPFRYRMPPPSVAAPTARPAIRTQDEAAAWLDREYRNILQAARYAARHEWKQQCADLIHALGGFMEIRAYWEEAATAHALALQASREVRDPARIARASLELSAVSQQTGRHDAALKLAEDAAGIYRSLGETRGVAEALDHIAFAHQQAGRSREALAYLREARLLFGEVDDDRGVANTLSHSGIASWYLGRYRDAIRDLHDALRLYRRTGDRRGEAKTLNNQGRMQLSFGYHRDAIEAYQQSLEIFRAIGGPQNEAILHHNIGSVYHYKGSYQEGIAAYRRALGIYRSIGDLPNEADVLNDLGALFHDAEDYDEALRYHQQARAIAEEIGNLAQQVAALRGIAGVRRNAGRCGEALEHYAEALRLAREIGDPYQEARTLEGMAEATLGTGRPDTARIIMLQALDIFEQLGVPEAEAARIRIDAMSPAFGRAPERAALA
jgi:DNA-binding SARP family transcriptional activator/tetratricopeptide (TPR) repeat protein